MPFKKAVEPGKRRELVNHMDPAARDISASGVPRGASDNRSYCEEVLNCYVFETLDEVRQRQKLSTTMHEPFDFP